MNQTHPEAKKSVLTQKLGPKIGSLPKRLMLFFAVNSLIVLTISVVLALLGVQPYLTSRGIDYSQLLAFCLIWGMGGAFISLALSRVMAKWMMGVEVLPLHTSDPQARALIHTVHQMAAAAGIRQMPEVGVYASPEINAFATGPTRNRALVAVSSGLLERLSPRQIEGVLGHEIAHVANGDMVTMTLVQGVVNAFVMFFARVIAWVSSQWVDEQKRGAVNFFTMIVLEMILGVLGMIVVAYFSRAREFRADQGGAALAGKDAMISALTALKNAGEVSRSDEPESIAAFKISGRRSGGFAELFSTHPPLEERIARLRTLSAL